MAVEEPSTGLFGVGLDRIGMLMVCRGRQFGDPIFHWQLRHR
ncbi:MAG TPA: hypothetical protein VGM32_22950 [Rhodopila sp.]